MASQVLSGATNASYTNNTGQNVRLIINYMSNVTSMTWAGVNVTASSTTIGKDIPPPLPQYTGVADIVDRTVNIEGTALASLPGSVTPSVITFTGPVQFLSSNLIANTFLRIPVLRGITLTSTTTSNAIRFPVDLMLSSGQSFSAVCGAFNLVAIREDGT